MRLELDDISIHAAKNQDKTICHSEKMTQTDIEILGRDGYGGYDKRFKTTPNGTSPCNHPTLSCQVFLFILLRVVFIYMIVLGKLYHTRNSPLIYDEAILDIVMHHQSLKIYVSRVLHPVYISHRNCLPYQLHYLQP